MEAQFWRDLRQPDARTCVWLVHPYILFIYLYMYPPSTSDSNVPVRRLQLDAVTGRLAVVQKKVLFVKGPIPLEWVSIAAALPGKALNVAVALWWQHGMAKGKPFKLTWMSLKYLSVERAGASAGLARLEQAGLIQVVPRPGQRPLISIVFTPPS